MVTAPALLNTRKKPGDTLAAAEVNALAAAAQAVLNARGVFPVRVLVRDGALVVSSDESAFMHRAVVTGVSGTTPGPPSGITYTVRAIDRRDIGVEGELAGLTPRAGRPVKNDEVDIHAAEVGDPCLLWEYPDGSGGREFFLEVVTEAEYYEDCQP